ncbi:MAG TPA: hypothetical protein VF546_10985 [Pyrinomonadaceae bacterium]|jgi:hypothetical protein
MRSLKLSAIALLLGVTGLVYAAGAPQTPAPAAGPHDADASCCKTHKHGGTQTAAQTADANAAHAACCADCPCCTGAHKTTNAGATQHAAHADGASCCAGHECRKAHAPQTSTNKSAAGHTACACCARHAQYVTVTDGL